MAKQKSIVKLSGTIDDITFSQTKDGFVARKSIKKVSKETLATDPKYARLRENISEFNRGVSAGKQMRIAVQDALLNCADKRLGTRMTQAMMAVLLSDSSGKRGERTVANGNVALLKGFNFSAASQLSTSMKLVFPSAIDRAAGKLTADIPSFVPEDVLVPSKGATHFKIHSVGLEINFDNNLHNSKLFESAGIALGTDPTPAISILHDLGANSTNPLFLLVGIKFYQEVNGVFYPLKSNSSNALTIIEAESAS
ncbi:MAG: hypothetical protein ABIN36_03585 [Ferruginibacter sp.]